MKVEHDSSQQRFVARTPTGDAVLGYERVGDDVLDLQHTVVPEDERGQGVGDALVRAAIEHARAEGLRVIPSCPFVHAWLERHDDARDVVAG